jgi:acetyl esterase
MASDQERILELMSGFKPPKSVAELRQTIESFSPILNANPPAIGALHEDLELRPGLRADVCVPAGAGPHPMVVFLHGGGWVAGSTKTLRKLAMQFAAQGYLTINVDYRLAPEHPFPAGFDDCTFGIKWAGENAHRWNGDPSRLAVGGDSAGANLTAASLLALAAERHAGPKPRAALLMYGVFDFAGLSAVDPANTGMAELMARAYLANQYPAAIADPRVSPIKGVKAGALPPCFIICGTADPLIAQSRELAAALQRADIRHELHAIESMPHAFMQMDFLPGCIEGHRLMFDFLKRTL